MELLSQRSPTCVLSHMLLSTLMQLHPYPRSQELNFCAMCGVWYNMWGPCGHELRTFKWNCYMHWNFHYITKSKSPIYAWNIFACSKLLNRLAGRVNSLDRGAFWQWTCQAVDIKFRHEERDNPTIFATKNRSTSHGMQCIATKTPSIFLKINCRNIQN